MSIAFVIHEHTGHGPSHYDLMLGDGDSLATWQLPASPLDLPPGSDMPATRIQPHRSAYLDYEGPVSRGRGEVRRIDRGTYERVHVDESRWRIRLHGQALEGVYDLRRSRDDPRQWTLSRPPQGHAATPSASPDPTA